jgi:hypothetical protein
MVGFSNEKVIEVPKHDMSGFSLLPLSIHFTADKLLVLSGGKSITVEARSYGRLGQTRKPDFG